jgi:hypothetical protein
MIVAKYADIAPLLNERSRRLWAAAESRALGYAGDALASAAMGLARATVRNGRRELEEGVDDARRVRRVGAGRPALEKTQPGLKEALEQLVDPVSRGDPMSPLRRTCKSRAKLAAALTKSGWTASSTTVGRLLHELGYSLQSVRKSTEGAAHPDRNAQFEHINATAADFLRRGQAVISVDTNEEGTGGRVQECRKGMAAEGYAREGAVHDFLQDAIGKAIPYGVYDMARNEAWVSVGRDHDTPAFAVASIRQWWEMMGKEACGRAGAEEIFITADAGGSNGYRARAWKLELQNLADHLKLRIRVSHSPPGTSKWNRIDHRLFCHIT